MKLSYNWLKEYLKCDLTPQEVADAMTAIGIEVDGVEEQEQIPGGLAGVVVARVLTCEAHPDSDHLHVTTVDAGAGEPVTVVCGAPNVAAGQKVLFAQIGTVLPGDFKIKKSKIRGVESFGMICAEDELGIGTDHAGIMVLPEDAVVGTPAKEYLKLGTEAVIEYEITANRIDAASHWGVARDLYAWLRLNGRPCELVKPSVDAFREGAGEGLPIEVRDSDGAPRYTGITLKGVKVGPSPEWLQQRLTSIGLRPINNIVDISNFVLFELGQPLHTFDAGKVGGGRVVVRRAAEGEIIRTLDGVERKLSARDMVIADTKVPMCIAGVFGGEDSGVTEATTDVFVESAYFDPASIRRTSKSQTLQTDASFRYERGADPEIPIFRSPAHHHTAAADLAGVEGVERLAQLEEHEIGDIDHVVDRAQPDAHQTLLEPFRRRGYLDAADRDARVARGAFAVAHLHRDPLALAFAECVHGRHHQLAGQVVEPQPGVQVAGHAPMGGRVDAVGRDLVFDHRLGAELEVFLGRGADHGVLRQDHDALVVGADTELVLRADHAEGLHAADLGFLDLEIPGQDRADLGEQYLLACGHVGRAAHHRQGFAAAGIHRGDMEMVGIRMRLAGQHAGHHDPGESAGNALLLLHAIDFDADRGHRVRHLLGREVTLQILFEPIVT